jgi:hypothetical protein
MGHDSLLFQTHEPVALSTSGHFGKLDVEDKETTV